MIYFNSDYLEGAHPALMAKLNETNMVQTIGYGEDEYCAAARVKIQNACQAPEADVHFLVGGTQTNTTVRCTVPLHSISTFWYLASTTTFPSRAIIPHWQAFSS